MQRFIACGAAGSAISGAPRRGIERAASNVRENTVSGKQLSAYLRKKS
jgi:hypothetical protein